jgi:RHS repeat-associated protein
VDRGANVVERYDYDANGNRIAASGPTGAIVSATYDGQDRLVSYGSVSYSYTRAGELKQRISGTDTTSYTYDELGNLITVVLPNHTRIDYVIDGMNRRVGRTVNGHTLTGWLYGDELHPVAELDSVGSVTARYVYGSRANVPDYVVKGGTTYRIVSDQLGSVRLVVRADSGQVAERIRYDAWGKMIEDTSPGFLTLGFAGGITDPDTKLVRFGARDYDPVAGRWTSKDPIGFIGGSACLFRYGPDDPVNTTDNLGLTTSVQFGLAGTAGSIFYSNGAMGLVGNNAGVIGVTFQVGAMAGVGTVAAGGVYAGAGSNDTPASSNWPGKNPYIGVVTGVTAHLEAGVVAVEGAGISVDKDNSGQSVGLPIPSPGRGIYEAGGGAFAAEGYSANVGIYVNFARLVADAGKAARSQIQRCIDAIGGRGR